MFLIINSREYETGSPVWTEYLEKELTLLKKYASKSYDEIWKMEDLNEPYFAQTKANLAYMFRQKENNLWNTKSGLLHTSIHRRLIP